MFEKNIEDIMVNNYKYRFNDKYEMVIWKLKKKLSLKKELIYNDNK